MNQDKKLTPIGKELASLPVDPRTARMILQANKEKSLYDVLVIASAISCQDPRERPEDKKTQADQKHALFKSRESDLITLLNLWEGYHSTLDELKTQGKMRKFCKANYLSYNRIREWRDIHAQLKGIAEEKGWNTKKPDNVDYDSIHRSILAGYLPHIAKKKEKKLYQGTKNRELMLFPGSDQYQSRHEWIVAIELIETSRLFAHRVAKIDPDWLESLAGNLCKKSWSEPQWEKESGRVIGYEKVTLFGFTLIEARKVFYGKIDRNTANQIFIREALVQGGFESNFAFWKHNQKLIREIEQEEAKLRSKILLVEDMAIEEFYLNRISGVACMDDFKKLIKKNSGDRFLFMKKSDLLRTDYDEDAIAFPSQLQIGDSSCRLSYLFEPGDPKDGITIHIPWSLLSSVKEEVFEYLVPGLVGEKITWLLKNLPKEERRKIVPIPDKAERILAEMTSLKYSTDESEKQKQSKEDFYKDLSECLFRVARVDISPDKWDRDSLPDYLRMNFAVRKPNSSRTIYSRNLKAFSETKTAKSKDNWKHLISPHQRWGITEWDFGNLLEKVPLSSGGDIELWGYRALEWKDSDLLLTICKTTEEALEKSLIAVPHLLAKSYGEELAWLYKELRFDPETLYRLQNLWDGNSTVSINTLAAKFNSKKPKVREAYHSDVQERAYQMVFNGILGFSGTVVQDKKAFQNQLQSVRFKDLGMDVVDWVRQSLKNYHEVLSDFEVRQASFSKPFASSMRLELASFLSQDCFEKISFEQWKHCPRILKCYQKRIDRAVEDPNSEEGRIEPIQEYQNRLQGYARSTDMSVVKKWAIQRGSWMLEEWKVSVFAQELSTAFPISQKRMDKFLSTYFL